ncbi:response regulator [Azospirillum sp. CT11-132]|jgi:DNA-binding response OmpR family regulator|uniref:response regulator n=1 Tax=unclassified Azospirillum TaxID=2630922 RepID=UPI000D604245|nr:MULTISPECIES: response regulator transcription factor [unclassified Azospirillum]PWC57538.1 transcriptional regulator [Azospirillum sp. TSH20]PWC59004.1 transcriptional regulator [Azospirillum sp. TSH7]QCG97935.1 response regulator transcription factor [Azospirillum sp. TSA2s]
MHILAVDDDEPIRELLASYLAGEGYRVTTAQDTASARQALDGDPVDLVVCDLRLPDGDGLGLVRQIRTESQIPVIILSSKDQDVDRIVGLELGADDYLTKPFNPRELLARIKAVLRRVSSDARPARSADELRAVVQFANWELDLTAQRLRGQEGREVELTKAEFGLLAAFVKRPQRVLTRDQLLDLTRVDGAEVFDRSIDVLILRLRRKIEANPKEPRIIKTERGAGYVFDAKVRTV